MPKVFVSHSSKDSDFVEAEIIDLLRRHHVDNWYSRDSIGAGDQWVQRIINALKQCDWFVVVLSPSSVEAKYVRYEVSWALENLDNGRIIPLLYEPCEPDRLHFALPFIQHIDFSKGHDLRKSRADLLRRWGVSYVESGEQAPAPPARRSLRQRIAGRPRAVAASGAAVASVVSLALWLGLKPDKSPLPPVPPVKNPEATKQGPSPQPIELSSLEAENRLLLATLPGLNGKWWFQEARWLAPAFRATALSAPAGTFDATIDFWRAEPEEVYGRLRPLLAEHSGPAQDLWGWLVPPQGAKPFNDGQLAREENKVAADTSKFRPHDWHTLASIRHHLAEKDDHYVAAADEAYRKAIEGYKQEGEYMLEALCLSDYSWFLINSNFYPQTLHQLKMAEDRIHELGPATVAKSGLFLAHLRVCKATAFDINYDWASEAVALGEAEGLLKNLASRPQPHPFQALICEQTAWMKMWQWDVVAAAGLFASARQMRSYSEGQNALSYLEKLHDLHGEAMIERFRGHSRRAQAALQAILAEIDAKLKQPEIRGDAIQTRDLNDRKFNSLERLADCDLFDARPAAAIKALNDALEFGRLSSLFNGSNRSDEVRLHWKSALASILADDLKSAELKIKKAQSLTPKEEQSNEGGLRLWIDGTTRLYTGVVDAVVRLAGKGREQARGDLREILRTREEKLDRDSHELLMLAAQLLITSDRVDPEAREGAEDDADLLLALITAIPQDSREALRGYLGRYYDTALGAKLGDEPGEVDEGVKRWALESWFGPGVPPTDQALLLFHFENHLGHAILYLPGSPARHYPLPVGRLELGKAGRDRQLPPDLAKALEGATVLVCWRPPTEAPTLAFPFDPPRSAKFEFQTPSEPGIGQPTRQ